MSSQHAIADIDTAKLLTIHPKISTLAELICDLSADQRLFLKYYKQDTLVNSLCFDDFYSQANQLAHFLDEKVPKKRTRDLRIAICMNNSDQILITYAACWLNSATIVPINPKESNDYIQRIVAHSESALLISDKEDSLSTVPQVTLNDILKFKAEDATKTSVKKCNNLPNPDDIAAIFYTSGTTSAPKGVMLSHRALLANMRSLVLTHAIKPDDIHLCILPLYHVNAFAFSFLTTLLARSQIALADSFHPGIFWNLVCKSKCNTANVVPEVLKRLCLETELTTEQMPDIQKNVRYFVSAASALTRQVFDEFSLRFPVQLIQGYGLSETVNFSLLIPPKCPSEEYLWAMTARERPSAGIAILGNEVTILDNENDTPCRAGQVGEIVIRGQNIMSGYLNNTEASQGAFRSGWFRTGDLGYYEEFGQTRYFFIAGRLKETVKRNSETIYIQDVEEALQLLPGCLNAAAFGFPNFFTGEEIGAVIIKSPDTPAPSEIAARMRQVLGWQKTPKIIKFVDTIPRTGSMKIQRSILAKQFQEYFSQKFSPGHQHAHG